MITITQTQPNYILIFIFYLCDILLAYIQCRFLIKFAKLNNKIRYYVIYFAIYTLLNIASATFGEWFFIDQNIATALGLLVVILFIKFVLKQSYITSVALGSLIMVTNVIVEGVLYALQSLIAINIANLVMESLLFILPMLILNFLILYFFEKNFTLITTIKSKNLFAVILPMIFIAFVIRALIMQTSTASGQNMAGTETSVFILIISVTSILCVYGALFAYNNIMGYFNVQKDVILAKERIKLQSEYIEEAMARYNQTAEFRHDFKNHIIALRGLLQKDKIKKAKAYLSRFEAIYSNITLDVNTGSGAIDALLREKIMYAKQQNINFSYDVCIPKTLSIDEFDLCTLFANLTDNAIKASGTVKKDIGYIDLAAAQKNSFYVIDIVNNYDDGASQTGLGLKIMEDTVKKYKGALNITNEKNTFRVSIILPFFL